MNLDKYKSKGLSIFNKYKLESILVVLLGSSPVIIAGILFTLGTALFSSVIIRFSGNIHGINIYSP